MNIALSQNRSPKDDEFDRLHYLRHSESGPQPQPQLHVPSPLSQVEERPQDAGDGYFTEGQPPQVLRGWDAHRDRQPTPPLPPGSFPVPS